VSPENDEVWITLKDLGKVQVSAPAHPFAQKWTLDTGPITNHVNSPTTATASSHTVAVNSLGLLDLVQIAAAGLAASTQYQVYLAESDHSPFGKLVSLAVLKTNPDGAGIVQAIVL